MDNIEIRKADYYTLNHKPIENIIDFSILKKEKNLLVQIFCGEKKETLEKIAVPL